MSRSALAHLADPAPAARIHAAPAGHLRINRPGNRYEHEAERAAERVTLTASHKAAWSLSRVGIDAPLQRGWSMLQRDANGGASAVAPPAVHNALHGSGRQMDASTRGFMESRFGYDFSRVRIFNDDAAAGSARAVSANAYTVGDKIVFDRGKYAPASHSGRRLLAHELSHVVQQSRGGSPPAPFPGSSLERKADEAASGVMRGGSARVAVGGSCAPGIAREAKSLTSTVDPSTLSNDELQNETMQVQQWLSEHAATSDPDSDHMMQALNALEAEVRHRQAKPAAPKTPILPTVKGDDKQQISAAMAQVESIARSTVAGGLFTMTVDGQHRDITQEQADEVRRKTKDLIKDSMGRATQRADYALNRYHSQQEVDKEHWLIAPIVKAFGRVKDPGPFLVNKVDKAKTSATGALAAAEGDKFVEAANLFATAEGSALEALKLWEAYFEGIINAGEMTVTVLEVTRDVAFGTLAICALVASGGAAAGLTSLGGVELGAASTANLIATAAPLLAEFGEAAEKAAYGDKVDWGKLAVDAVVTVVLYKFGGKLAEGIAGKLVAQNPEFRTIGQRVVAGAVSSMITGKMSAIFSSTAHALASAAGLSKENITFEKLTDELAAQMADPRSTLKDALIGGLLGGAQAKGEGLGMKLKGRAASKPAPKASAQTPAAAAPAGEKVETPAPAPSPAPAAPAPATTASPVPEASAPVSAAPVATPPVATPAPAPALEIPTGLTPSGPELSPGPQPTGPAPYGELDLGPTPEGEIELDTSPHPDWEVSLGERDLTPASQAGAAGEVAQPPAKAAEKADAPPAPSAAAKGGSQGKTGKRLRMESALKSLEPMQPKAVPSSGIDVPEAGRLASEAKGAQVSRDEQLAGIRSRDEVEEVRKGTPSNPLKKQARARTDTPKVVVGQPDPAFPGLPVDAVEVDHVFPLDRMYKLKGAAMLDKAELLELGNTPENLAPVSKKVNGSRQNMTYKEWAATNPIGQQADPSFVTEMSNLEEIMEIHLQEKVDELVRRKYQTETITPESGKTVGMTPELRQNVLLRGIDLPNP